jgi:hypothetical protein
MKNNSLQHVGILGMHWGHRKGSAGEAAGIRAKAAVNELDAVRKTRSTTTKIGDWVLSSRYREKLHSEKVGKTSAAKKGAELVDELKYLRSQRTKGQKIVDALLTPERSSKLFSEMEPKKQRSALALSGLILAANFGYMAVSYKAGKSPTLPETNLLKAGPKVQYIDVKWKK